MKQPELSIIIPAYLEGARIGSSLEELADFMNRHNYAQTEVVVAVADSPDNTLEVVRSKAHLFSDFHLVLAGPKAGKGRDVRTGMFEARGKYKLFMDADLATPLVHLNDVHHHMTTNPEVIIAVRDLRAIHGGLRKWVSNLGNWLTRAVLLPGISDTQCGFKAFREDAAEELFGRQTVLGWGFDMEILAVARILGYQIVQINTPDWKDEPGGSIAGSMSSAALYTLGELFTILINRWTGRYRRKHFSYRPYKP